MGQAGPKFRKTVQGFTHWCPACGEIHLLPNSWQFNGNLEAPTFTPSFRQSGHITVKDEKGEWLGDWVRDAEGKAIRFVCHYIVTDGRIHFCGDCTHEMAGKTIDMPDLPEWLRD